MAFQRISQLGLDLSITRCFSYKHIFRYYLYLYQWFKLKKTTNWKYLSDDTYPRAHNSIYSKKYKIRSSIYLTVYSDNYQNISVYSCIKILSGIRTPMDTTLDTNWRQLQCKFKSQTKNVKVVKVKGTNIENWYFVLHLLQHNQTI